MAGIAGLLSGAVGLAVGIAIARGFANRAGTALGNFWVDLIRALLYVLVPLAIAGSLFLVAEGVVQTLAANAHIRTLAGGTQMMALGPVASEKAVTLLGSSGAGFYGVNSAMPFENPTGLANFVELLMVLAIPAALTATYGRIVGNRRQGWALYGVMVVMFVGAAAVAYPAESSSSPAMRAAGVHSVNMEARKTRGGDLRRGRLGPVRDAPDGPAGGVRRRIDGRTHAGVPGQADRGARDQAGHDRGDRGPADRPVHDRLGDRRALRDALDLERRPAGFSETLYAYTSEANNNGSAFAGYVGFLQPHPPGNVGATGITFADLAGGAAMLIGRFLPMLAALAVAGSLSGKRTIVAGEGTMRTDTAVFAGLLLVTISIVALLTFVPSLMLGPLVQSLTPRLF
jgi:K+-transporting ATPase ATPase A chain